MALRRLDRETRESGKIGTTAARGIRLRPGEKARRASTPPRGLEITRWLSSESKKLLKGDSPKNGW
ncbi:MAG: hypothetical protein ACKODK_07210, partial [Opitutaceae bacterium]